MLAITVDLMSPERSGTGYGRVKSKIILMWMDGRGPHRCGKWIQWYSALMERLKLPHLSAPKF